MWWAVGPAGMAELSAWPRAQRLAPGDAPRKALTLGIVPPSPGEGPSPGSSQKDSQAPSREEGRERWGGFQSYFERSPS